VTLVCPRKCYVTNMMLRGWGFATRGFQPCFWVVNLKHSKAENSQCSLDIYTPQPTTAAILPCLIFPLTQWHTVTFASVMSRPFVDKNVRETAQVFNDLRTSQSSSKHSVSEEVFTKEKESKQSINTDSKLISQGRLV